MSLVLFFAGLWLGGTIGVFTMCLFQISGKCAEKEEALHCLYSGEGGNQVRNLTDFEEEREVKCK